MLVARRSDEAFVPLVRTILCTVGLLLPLACVAATGSSQPVDIVVSVTADSDVPLGGVPVRVDGEVAGQTSVDGLLRISVSSSLRREVRLEPVCPDGYLQPDEPSILRLRSYGREDAGSSLELELICRPALRSAVFIVLAVEGPRVVIRLDGEVVAHTNDDGVAHFARSARAGTKYLLELDASEHPGLLPRSTAHRFELPERNEIFVVEQKFELHREVRKSRAPRRPRIIKIE